jgi:ATP-dependent RNA helicase RhlE
MTFNDLTIIEPVLKALVKEGYDTPTPIQEKAIPIIMSGKDVLGCAQTGTGKTAAFSIPVIQQILSKSDNPSEKKKKKLKALILTPTRELALQVYESFVKYSAFTTLKSSVIYGGVNQSRQVNALRKGVDILIATPGRLLDLAQQGFVDFSNVEYFVLDEADRMLDMGFMPDIRKVVSSLQKKRQTLMFSATMPAEIEKLAVTLLYKPKKIEITPESSVVDAISQYVYFISRENKTMLLSDVLSQPDIDTALVFSRTKHGADKISKKLLKQRINNEVIHGNKSQNARQKTLMNFKKKKIKILVATDIAARGIDVSRISHVINYDMPEDPETYVHRIGRTGRAGNMGTAISFCDNSEKKHLKSIQKLTGKSLLTLHSQTH